MSSHEDVVDAEDLGNLRAVRELFAHADPVARDLTERIKFALTVQAMHAEVAELMDTALLATRSAAPRVEPSRTDSVTFTAAAVSLMITANEGTDGDRVRIDGWVTVPGARVEAVTPEGSSSAVTDADGRFVLDDLPHGPVHFVILTDPVTQHDRPVITPTMQI